MQPDRFTVKNIFHVLRILLIANVLPSSVCNARPKKWVAQESTPVALTTCEIERASEHDAELKSVRECFLNGKWRAIEFKEYLHV